MNPKQFLMWGGVILLVLGLLGWVAGAPAGSAGGPLGSILWLTPGENIAHLVLGIVAIIAAYVLGAGPRKWLTVLVGVVALYYGVWGFMLPTTDLVNYNVGYGSANLEMLDNLIHLAVAAWAFWAASKSDSMM